MFNYLLWVWLLYIVENLTCVYRKIPENSILQQDIYFLIPCSSLYRVATMSCHHPQKCLRGATNYSPYNSGKGGHGGAVGWSIALRAGRSRFRFPMVSFVFFCLHFVPAVDSFCNINDYQEYFLGSKGGRCLGLTYFIWKSHSIGALQACTWFSLPFTLLAVQETQMCGLVSVLEIPVWFFLSCAATDIQVTYRLICISKSRV